MGGFELTPAFLGRVRTATLILGAVGALAVTTYSGWREGVAVLSGLILSLANLQLLRQVFQRMLRPEQDRLPAWTLLLVLPVKLLLLFGGTWLCLGPLSLSVPWFLAGFSLLLVVILLKVVGRMIAPAGPPRPLSRSTRARRSHPPILPLLLLAAIALPLLALADSRSGVDPGAGHPGGAVEASEPGGHDIQGHGMDGHVSGAHEAGEHGEDGHGEGSHVPELPSIFHFLHNAFPDAAWAATLYKWQNPIHAWLVILLLCVVSITVHRKRTLIPGKLQNLVEMMVEAFANLIDSVLGPRGRQFIPFLGTLFFYIWLNNLQGLIPFLKSPTSVIETTLSLGITVFLYVQYTGLRNLGLGGYLHHMLGSPQDLIGWCMVPLMLPLHIIEEIAKPISLSLRLFGNILGEDVLLAVFAGLGLGLVGFLGSPVGVPLHLPFIFLSLLMGTIQALVFTLLATIYFSQMLPHDHEEHDELEAGHPGEHAPAVGVQA